MDRTTEVLVLNAIEKSARRFSRRYGGDPDEWLAEAFFHAGKAALSYKEGIGTLQGWVARSVWFGLLESYRKQANRDRIMHRTSMPEKASAPVKWDRWCRRLAAELEGDAAVVILAAMEAPGEVVRILLGAGWSGPRVISAVQQVKESIT